MIECLCARLWVQSLVLELEFENETRFSASVGEWGLNKLQASKTNKAYFSVSS